MEAKVLYIEMLGICSCVMGILLYSDISRGKGQGPVLLGQKILRYLYVVNIIAMIIDGATILYDGTDFSYSRTVMYSSMCLYYIVHPLVSYLFLLYIDFELYSDKQRFRKRIPYYSILVFVTTFFSIVSLWTGWFFVIDSNNVYHRGQFWYIHTILSLLNAVYAVAVTMGWARKVGVEGKLGREQVFRMILLPLLPCVGALFQGLLPGTVWVFPLTTMGLLVNYVILQNWRVSRDHLTGLYNRRYLENFLNIQLRNQKKGKAIFLILLDIDHFKSINDTYGHLMGDDALIQAAFLLRSNCKRREDYVVRLGGDEFVIIGECEQVETVDMIVERMERMTRQFNQNHTKPYEISFSIGYSLSWAGSNATLDSLINEADQKMYANKRAKKQKRDEALQRQTIDNVIFG